jgi:predicted transcriptional regulator
MGSNHTIHIGIASPEAIRERTIAIAEGRIKPGASEPKIWLTSPKMIAELLSPDNIELLKKIQQIKPDSVTSLAAATGRQQGNLSRTLKAMSDFGLVEMVRENRHVRPVARATHLQLDIALI